MAVLGFTVDHHETVDSTQNAALDILRGSGFSEAVSGTVILAERQTSGRGRQGRVWETPVGNLAATMIWHLGRDDQPGDYSLIVAVAWADVIESILVGHSRESGNLGHDHLDWIPASVGMTTESKSPLSIKWPNDILVGGQKISGILIERPELDWLLIGTGVNVAYAPDDRTCLAHHACAGTDLSLPHVLDLYLERFLYWVKTYRQGGIASVCAAWMSRAHGVGQPMTVRLPTETFDSVFRGLDPDGAARAELPDGRIRRVHSGEVFFG